MKIGLIDVDAGDKPAKFPNLALMKLAAWHKRMGDDVEWWFGFNNYDVVYMSKVFDDTYTNDVPEPLNAKEVVKGGTGYSLQTKLPDEIEHIYPDYSLYPHLTKDTAFGFLSRGCPRGCNFCIVSEKEGRRARKVADLNEWWDGQKYICLMDPNILACKEHMDLLRQLEDSKSYVDFNQGVDCRLLTEGIIDQINKIRLRNIHFAWDYMKETDKVLRGLNLYKQFSTRKVHGDLGTVYILTNFDTTMQENLYRIYTVRDMGYKPYVMVFDKKSAPADIRKLQRWCNNYKIFKSCKRFEDYRG